MSASIPQTAYLKLMDIWFVYCITSLFLVVVTVAFINWCKVRGCGLKVVTVKKVTDYFCGTCIDSKCVCLVEEETRSMVLIDILGNKTQDNYSASYFIKGKKKTQWSSLDSSFLFYFF